MANDLEQEVHSSAPLPETGSPVVNMLAKADKFSQVIQMSVGLGTAPTNWLSENNLPATCDTQGASCVFNEAAASAICIAVDVRMREMMLEKLTAQYLRRVYDADGGTIPSQSQKDTASHWADEIVAELWS